MKIMIACLGLALWAVTAAPAYAAPEIKTLKCLFDKDGIITHWNEDGSIKVEKGKYADKPEGAVLAFDFIDKAKRSAKAVSVDGTADVALVNSGGMLSFFQVSPNGNQILVSVFTGSPLKDKTYPAVISRHTTSKEPLVSQYYGACINLGASR